MVRANCANTNAEIHATLSSDPQARRSMFNALSPAAGGGTGCALALGPAEGGRAWGRSARVSDAHPRDARLRRSLTRSDRGDRSGADTGERRQREGAADGASTTCLVKDHAKISGGDK
jgi:hypothetical protein